MTSRHVLSRADVATGADADGADADDGWMEGCRMKEGIVITPMSTLLARDAASLKVMVTAMSPAAAANPLHAPAA